MTVKQKFFETELINAISWADVSLHYFGKSNSWLYHKLDNNDFSEEEIQKLKESLKDLAKRIEACSEEL